MRGNEKNPTESRMLGELRRFQLKTDDPAEIEELDRVIAKKKLSRRDLGVILLSLDVRPGFCREDFGIWSHNTQAHP